MSVEVKRKIPEVKLRTHIELDAVHIFLQKIIGGRVAVVVFEDLQELVCQLEVVWVFEAASPVLDGSIEEFPWEVAMDIAHIESCFKKGTHNIVNLLPGEGCGSKGVLYGFHDCQREAVPCLVSVDLLRTKHCAPGEYLNFRYSTSSSILPSGRI